MRSAAPVHCDICRADSGQPRSNGCPLGGSRRGITERYASSPEDLGCPVTFRMAPVAASRRISAPIAAAEGSSSAYFQRRKKIGVHFRRLANRWTASRRAKAGRHSMICSRNTLDRRKVIRYSSSR
jgi:hypothetical protein